MAYGVRSSVFAVLDWLAADDPGEAPEAAVLSMTPEEDGSVVLHFNRPVTVHRMQPLHVQDFEDILKRRSDEARGCRCRT
jgi:hypothetical protein